jgi:hypothetical protein
MSLSLNSHNINSTDSGTTTNTIIITNWSANDIIIVVAPNQISTSVSGITDNSGQSLSWAQRADSTGAFHIETWWARAPSNFSGTVTITVNYTGGTPTYNPLIVLAVSGAVTSGSPFDGTASRSTSGDASYTTTHANSFVFTAARMSGTGGPTAGSGWTVTDTPAHFFGAEYQIASSTGPFTGNWTTGNGDQNGEIVDAIVAAGGVTAPKRAHIAAPVLPFFYA